MRMAIAEIVAGALEGLRLRYPEPSEEERARYAELRQALHEEG